MTTATHWRISALVSLIALVTIVAYWYQEVKTYTPTKDQLPTEADVNALLTRDSIRATSSRHYVPTGVFIQSLKFTSPTDVNLTGYVWQKYDAHFPDSLRGVVFPEQVLSNQTIFQKAYRRPDGEGKEVTGWYFDITLRQPFDYTKYPLDRQDVWMRMWFHEFDEDVVLTPDLASYDPGSTKLFSEFGLDDEIVPGGWDIEETYYFYEIESYDTNFGITNYVGQKNFPELHFNIVVKRKFFNAFIVNLVPVLVVALLLFAILMIATADREKAGILGFNTSGVVGTCSALFFVILLAHIQLRQQFAGSGVVYLEYFFIVSYVAILAVALNTYVLSMDSIEGRRDWLHKDDNLLPKVLFWPIYLGVLAIITALHFA